MSNILEVSADVAAVVPANRKAKRVAKAKGKTKAKKLNKITPAKGAVEVNSTEQGKRLLNAACLAAARKEGDVAATLHGIALFQYNTYGVGIALDVDTEQYKKNKEQFGKDWDANRNAAPEQYRNADALSNKTKGTIFSRLSMYIADVAIAAGVKLTRDQKQAFAKLEKTNRRNQKKGKNDKKDILPHGKEVFETFFKRLLKDGIDAPRGKTEADWAAIILHVEKAAIGFGVDVEKLKREEK